MSRIDRGTVHVCYPTLWEIGFSAQSAADWRETIDGPFVSRLIPEYLTPRREARALTVQELLAQRGHHRVASVADLLIAAVGEGTNLTVLHVDKDFDLIAEVTGQSVESLSLASLRP
ncbi:MAG: hypothetical protein LBQ06_04030 [Frankiaceae bacterium]|jgi:predicted nucleic acid-binding protein|nr:hypothetical protein [Frankiaceae bacterium]